MVCFQFNDSISILTNQNGDMDRCSVVCQRKQYDKKTVSGLKLQAKHTKKNPVYSIYYIFNTYITEVEYYSLLLPASYGKSRINSTVVMHCLSLH